MSLRNAWCTSTNFELFPESGVNGNCELFKHDISTINDDNFHDHHDVTFSFYLKECLRTGCLNGGSCLFNEKKEMFSCSCKLPWTGENCGVKMGGDSRLRRLDGGKGAKVNGKVYLNEGTKMIVLVGQRGTGHPFSPGAGGGRTFVVYSTYIFPLGIAGGGGGANGGIGGDGGPGKAGEAEGLMLGIVGKSGRLGCEDGFNGTGGKSFLDGGRGGSKLDDEVCCDSGFGGGGASSSFTAGGGGGYSGGSGCVFDSDGDDSESGGGGSFVPDNTWNAETGACSKGDGYVTFRFLG
ncbi:hypothetical protein ACROYT_G012295 [Oculina patagonica]